MILPIRQVGAALFLMSGTVVHTIHCTDERCQCHQQYEPYGYFSFRHVYWVFSRDE